MVQFKIFYLRVLALIEKIRSKLTLDNLFKYEQITEILSYDRQIMKQLNIWPPERVDIRLLFFYFFTMGIPSVSSINF